MHSFIKRSIICISTVLALILGADLSAGPLPSVLRVDYADYNPLSLVLRKFNWLDEEFKQDNVRIHWVFSPGSDAALKNLQADSLDIASTGSLSSLWSKANGNSIKAFYVFGRPEWAAVLVSHDSPLGSVKDLKGKSIASPTGTDAYFFLLRALHDAGLHKDDVRIISLPHKAGKAVVENHFVDAWGGVEPYAAISQLDRGSRVLYRNVHFNSYGVLNITGDFARKYPEVVSRVVNVYEKARKWAIMHSDEFRVIYAEEARVSLPVSRIVLGRYDFSRPVFEHNDITTLKDGSSILKEEKFIRQDTDVDMLINDLIDSRFVNQLHLESVR
ncbi:MAG: aliphatic sulfonate ABC transporter substrate-binding protein [Chlorobiaceae bacterium]|nr:aliphatic sulfonate ABC transporter substrate-binding protein [Chlorobiaceae bacterium]